MICILHHTFFFVALQPVLLLKVMLCRIPTSYAVSELLLLLGIELGEIVTS